jgi:hypothetical protein
MRKPYYLLVKNPQEERESTMSKINLALTDDSGYVVLDEATVKRLSDIRERKELAEAGGKASLVAAGGAALTSLALEHDAQFHTLIAKQSEVGEKLANGLHNRDVTHQEVHLEFKKVAEDLGQSAKHSDAIATSLKKYSKWSTRGALGALIVACLAYGYTLHKTGQEKYVLKKFTNPAT